MALRLPLDAASTSKTTPFMNSIFMSTVYTAAKTLAAVASAASGEGDGQRWSPKDHLRYMFLLMIWMTLWFLRVLVDYFPSSIVPSTPAILDGFASSTRSSSSNSLVLYEASDGGSDSASGNAIGRALERIFALVNEIPATSRKYQFAIGIAEKIVDENAKEGHECLTEINRAVLSTAFARTSNLLYRSLKSMNSIYQMSNEEGATWPSRIIFSLPFGSHLLSYFKGILFCIGSFFPSLSSYDTRRSSEKSLGVAGEASWAADEGVVAEKLAQELLWIANKMRLCSAVDEAVVQWSFASGLASLSLTANPRVQSSIVKMTAILIRELARGEFEVSRQVKFQLLALWLPLFSYAGNGLTNPILSGNEKNEMERVIEDVISSLPTTDQEVILANWVQDFTNSSSDWPNLQRCFDRWCRCSRKLLL